MAIENKLVLSVKLDFPIIVNAALDSEDDDYFYISFSEPELIKQIKLNLSRPCFCKLRKKKHEEEK